MKAFQGFPKPLSTTQTAFRSMPRLPIHGGGKVIGFEAGGPPENGVAGDGTLDAIFGTAVEIWESAIPDPFTTTVYYGWFPLPDGVLGMTNNTSGTNQISSIRFNNRGTTSLFLDATLGDADEYLAPRLAYANLGGGLLNVGRW